MTVKHPNHLASQSEQQGDINARLPATLSQQLKQRQQATQELKTLLADCLPAQILANCYVVTLSERHLTIAVESVTAANHIRYLKSAYIKLLNEQSLTFNQLSELSVIVVNFSKN